MRRLWAALSRIYLTWKYCEEVGPGKGERVSRSGPAGEEEELKEALAKEERRLEDYRRYRCEALARESEASVRSLRSRLRALEL